MMTKHWHPEDIKAAVRKKGTSLTELARNKGLAPGSVRNASRNPSRAAELVIA
ncbi:helix-turn-helix domain-containing protein, partial [Iodobacter sp.]|uniref:helix-turn-helix domain-containing protein n=1 Tax=Iodobacter sp. TaxID=1915058 RepID=UPI0035B5F23E